MTKPGDVVVIAAGGETEEHFWWTHDNLYEIRGVAGIVDGCIRDADAISKMDIPVYAKGIS